MSPREIPARLTALRGELKRHGLTCFLVPRADEHQGEYVAPHAERLRWISGFTGSAGLAAILADAAAIWVDGRYTLQVRDQVPADLFETHHVTKSPPAEWLAKRLRPGDRLGYDPWLHTVEGVERLRAVCATAGAELVAVPANPVDAVWVDRPGPPLAPLVVHEAAYAGRDSADKRREVARALEDARVEAAVLTAPESIAWLLNLRGGDVRHTPLPLSFALVHKDATVDLFVDARKVGPAIAPHLGPDVRLARPAISARRWIAWARPARRSCWKPRARRRGSPSGWRPPAARSCAAPTPARCRRRARTRSSWPGRAPPTGATAPRCAASSPGSPARRPAAS